jgi:ribulose bisphosphate carboxylase small subunit
MKAKKFLEKKKIIIKPKQKEKTMTTYTPTYKRENIELQCRRLLAKDNFYGNEHKAEEIQNLISYAELAQVYIEAQNEVLELKRRLKKDELQEKLNKRRKAMIRNAVIIPIDNGYKIVFVELNSKKDIVKQLAYLEFTTSFEEAETYIQGFYEGYKIGKYYSSEQEPTTSKKEIVAEKQKGLTFEEWKKVKSFSVFGYRYIKENETLYRVAFFNTIADNGNFKDMFIIQQFSDEEKPSLEYLGFKEDRKTATFDDITDIEFAEEKSEPMNWNLMLNNLDN